MKKYIKNIQDEEVSKFEKKYGIRLHEVHKEYLRGNLSFPSDKYIFEFIEKGKRTTSSISSFFNLTLDKISTFSYLENIFEIYKVPYKRLPINIIPIADDEGGNLICISCGEKDYGYIYFWDHENEVDYSVSDDSDYSNLYLIAKSFDEFINGLMTEEEADKRFSEIEEERKSA